MSDVVTDAWLAQNTTVSAAPGERVTLAVTKDYEVSDQVDPDTGARLLFPVGRSGRPSKNARVVKTRDLQQVVRIVGKVE